LGGGRRPGMVKCKMIDVFGIFFGWFFGVDVLIVMRAVTGKKMTRMP
jgi:hypothetical protein